MRRFGDRQTKKQTDEESLVIVELLCNGWFNILNNFLGDFKEIELDCVMNGFEGNSSSQPKWTTDFKDEQIGNRGEKPFVENENARWKISINISKNDAGIKVCCKIKQCT